MFKRFYDVNLTLRKPITAERVVAKGGGRHEGTGSMPLWDHTDLYMRPIYDSSV